MKETIIEKNGEKITINETSEKEEKTDNNYVAFIVLAIVFMICATIIITHIW